MSFRARVLATPNSGGILKTLVSYAEEGRTRRCTDQCLSLKTLECMEFLCALGPLLDLQTKNMNHRF